MMVMRKVAESVRGSSPEFNKFWPFKNSGSIINPVVNQTKEERQQWLINLGKKYHLKLNGSEN